VLLPWNFAAAAWDEPASWGRSNFIGASFELPRYPNAWADLRALPTKPLPGELWEGQLRYDTAANSYHEHAVTVDRYGDALVMCRARDVAIVLRHHAVDAPMWSAAAAFLESLPPDYPVILFWH